MTQAQLTPVAIQIPALAEVNDELSGPQWCSRFLGSNSTNTLTPAFKASCDTFIAAIKEAGGNCHISATFRPPERAYLMHWSWKIKHGTDPSAVPSMANVNIEWVHSTHEASVNAANQMVAGYQMNNLNVAPSLTSLHTNRSAIDMTISWSGNLVIAKQDGTIVTITTTPRTGMNTMLKDVGRSYGVIKFIGGNSDRPHWSTTGH